MKRVVCAAHANSVLRYGFAQALLALQVWKILTLPIGICRDSR
jgi:hypothetical protein